MSKNIICKDCYAIGSLGDDEMLYDNKCPLCGGQLLLVHPADFWLLLNRSDYPLMPGVWGKAYEEKRNRTTCVQYRGKMPKVRTIRDRHPCEKCKWHGTYQPDAKKTVEQAIGGEQKTLEVK